MRATRKRGWLLAVCCAMACALGGSAWAQERTLQITLAGQSMIRCDPRVDTPSLSSTVAPLLKGDVVFTNFEATVFGKNESVRDGNFVSPPEALDALKGLGFNLVSLANNHAFDLKASGIDNTIAEANRLNLTHAGTGNTIEEAVAPGYLHTPNGTVALIAMASGLVPAGGAATTNRPGVDELHVEAGNQPNQEDANRILQSIREARKHADVVIVYQHNHVFDVNFFTLFDEELPQRLEPPEWIKNWTHAEIDAGADIVVMHGAPLDHGVEIYRGRPIFYDLGNFIFQLPPTNTRLEEPMIWESVVAHVEFHGNKLRSVQFQPIFMNKLGRGQADTEDPHADNLFLRTRGLPHPATGEQAHYILQRIADASRPFGTVMQVNGETAEIKLEAN